MTDVAFSARELGRRLGISHTAVLKAEKAGRIEREPDGTWDIARSRKRMIETADPERSPLVPMEATPRGRLKVAKLALEVEMLRMQSDVAKGKLLDIEIVNERIDAIAIGLRDPVLNWPARVAPLIAADLGLHPHQVQASLYHHICGLLNEVADRFDSSRQEGAAAGGEQ